MPSTATWLTLNSKHPCLPAHFGTISWSYMELLRMMDRLQMPCTSSKRMLSLGKGLTINIKEGQINSVHNIIYNILYIYIYIHTDSMIIHDTPFLASQDVKTGSPRHLLQLLLLVTETLKPWANAANTVPTSDVFDAIATLCIRTKPGTDGPATP